MYEDTKGQPSHCSVCCCIICWWGVWISSLQGQQRGWKRVTVTQTNVLMYQHHFMLIPIFLNRIELARVFFFLRRKWFYFDQTDYTNLAKLHTKLCDVQFSARNWCDALISLGIFSSHRIIGQCKTCEKMSFVGLLISKFSIQVSDCILIHLTSVSVKLSQITLFFFFFLKRDLAKRVA